MKIGPSHESSTVLGPVQNELQYSTVKGFVDDCVKNGYRFALNGPEAVQPTQGFFMNPAVIDNPPDSSMIVEEEPFGTSSWLLTSISLPKGPVYILMMTWVCPAGPIVPLLKWTTVEEVVRRANSTNTGLGACVWTKDLAVAESVAKKLEAGSVWINSYEKLRAEVVFSGHKESGLGAEMGPQALMSWVRPKATHIYH